MMASASHDPYMEETFCKKFLPVYIFLFTLMALLIIVYMPLFTGFGTRYFFILALLILFQNIYKSKKEGAKSYLEYGCFYGAVILFLINVLSLYQIIFGDPTNWLGTGFDLTTLPEI